MNDEEKLKIFHEQTNPLQIINLSSSLFNDIPENPPYRCKSYRTNMELKKLESDIFRENYSQMESESGVNIPAYARDIGYCDEPDVEILTEYEYMALPVRPPRIDELKKEIRKSEDAELLAGITHYRNYSGYHISEMVKTVDVPKFHMREQIP